MNETRTYAVEQLKTFYKKDASKYEQALYDKICDLYSDQKSFDYLQFNRNYKHYLMTILENLRFHNTEFKKMIKKHSFDTVLEMEVVDWIPSLYQEYQFKSEINNELREGQYKCNNCAKNNDYYWNTSYYEMQTRSSDEPTTIFITCHTCKKKWKTS